MRINPAATTSGGEPSGKAVPRGFPRWAWWALILATLTFAVPLTSPWWSTLLRAEIPDSTEDEGGPDAASLSGATSVPSPEAPGSTLIVLLHMRVADKSGLGLVEREIPYVRGVVPQIMATVSELGVGSNGVPPLLPVGTRVLDVAYTRSGTAYVDFSTELEAGRGVGADEERALVQGIVTTIMDNFTAVRRVLILVDGKTPRPGHLDLTRALRRDDPIFIVDDEPEAPIPAPLVEVSPDAPSPRPSVNSLPPKIGSSPLPKPSSSPDKDFHSRP